MQVSGARYYKPELGRWLSRDPIGEWGGLDLYSVAYNDTVNAVDMIGLMGFKPRRLREPPVPSYPEELKSCCDKQGILDQGEIDLNDIYRKVAAEIDRQGFRPAAPGEEGATCKKVSPWILSFFRPTPKCWHCWLEERDAVRDDVKDEKGDHQYIVCKSEEKAGAHLQTKEIVFDWWGDRKLDEPAGPGGPIPPGFEDKWPYCVARTPSICYTGCNGDVYPPWKKPTKPDIPKTIIFK